MRKQAQITWNTESKVPASYKTSAVLLIYTVKSNKSLGSDNGVRNSIYISMSILLYGIIQ
jgi:hypothetical protein